MGDKVLANEKHLATAIAALMAQLSLMYVSANFQEILESEDSAYVFLHIFGKDLELQDPLLNLAGDKAGASRAIIYTVAPVGNKDRYPDDVLSNLTLHDWCQRMRLLGSNVVELVDLYNKHAKRECNDELLPITSLWSSMVGGGEFLFREPGEKAASAETMTEHSRGLCEGFLQGLEKSTILRQILVPPQPPELHEGVMRVVSSITSQLEAPNTEDADGEFIGLAGKGEYVAVDDGSAASGRRVSMVTGMRVDKAMSLKIAARNSIHVSHESLGKPAWANLRS